MTRLSDLFLGGAGADAVAADIAAGKIAYGAGGLRIVGPTYPVTTLLLHMNGADTSTTFTDNSSYINSMTAAGNAQLDTADKKFGSASGLFDGTGDYVYATYVADEHDWFVEDFTIDCWVKAAAWTTWGSGSTPCLLGRSAVASGSSYWGFGPMTDGKLRFSYYNGATQTVTSTGTIATD